MIYQYFKASSWGLALSFGLAFSSVGHADDLAGPMPPPGMADPLPTASTAPVLIPDQTVANTPTPAIVPPPVAEAPLTQSSEPVAAAVPQPAPPAPVVAPAPPVKHIIVIDPGHGGIDPGAISPSGLREKVVVLAFAQELKSVLEDTGKFDVHLTRDDDKFIALGDRLNAARNDKAELFIALHADTLNDDTVRGATIYTMSEDASDWEAARLAKKENGVDILGGLPVAVQNKEVANALLNLVQRESQSNALSFAQMAVADMRPVTHFTSKPMRSADFVVLKAPDVPSVLVELGYLSNGADAAALASPKWRRTTAEAMAQAVQSFLLPATTAAK